jgi:phage terminase large subunit
MAQVVYGAVRHPQTRTFKETIRVNTLSTLKIPTARAFEPLLEPARYKGVYGGRGSGKSHFFGELLVETCQAERGTLAVCIREAQRTLSQSSKRLIESKIAALGLGQGFKVFADKIETPGDGVIIFRGMQDHTAESIKSLEGFRIAWIDEAQSLSARSLALLRPTIRANNSELWASWNPRRKSDAIDDFLRARKPAGAIVVKASWRDNPWFPTVLEEERRLDLRLYPDRYEHVWEGDYVKSFEGAYFATMLSEARAQGRIGKVAADPLLPLRAFIDIGGAGATADAFTIWIVQWVGNEIRVLDYYESAGQVLAFHVNWLRSRGYQNAILYLPHDGVAANNITGKRYEDHLREAGFAVEPPVKNQGRGAAMMRIEALRRLGPQIWWNEATTEAGRDAIGFYHERRDDERNIGLGPEHDWSSHAADALGLMAICYEEPGRAGNFNRPIRYAENGWR